MNVGPQAILVWNIIRGKNGKNEAILLQAH